MSIYLGSIIDFHHIVFTQNCIITWIWRIMSSTMINTATRWKSYTLSQSICLDKSFVWLFNSLADVDQFHARPHVGLGFLSDLSMAFSCLSKVVDFGGVKLVFVSVLSIGDSFGVEITRMIHPFALRKNIVWKLRGNWNCVVNRLFPCIGGSPIS